MSTVAKILPIKNLLFTTVAEKETDKQDTVTLVM